MEMAPKEGEGLVSRTIRTTFLATFAGFGIVTTLVLITCRGQQTELAGGDKNHVVDAQVNPLDVEHLVFEHADTFLQVSIPISYWKSDSSNRYRATHPSVIFVPGKLWGYRYWMVMTPYDYSINENPCIRTSNDNITWEIPADNPDVYPDPIWSWRDVTCSTCCTQQGLLAEHLSDPEIILDAQKKLWVVFRATFNYGPFNLEGNADSATCVDRPQDDGLFATGTTDGYIWSKPVRIVEADTLRDYMSPAIVMMPSGRFRMWVVEGMPTSVWEEGENAVIVYEANRIDTIWDSVGVCDWQPFYNGDTTLHMTPPHTPADITLNSLYYLWHLDVMAIGSEKLVAFITLQAEPGSRGLKSHPLYVCTSHDQGMTWQTRTSPALTGDSSGTWNNGLYKSACVLVGDTLDGRIGLYVGAATNVCQVARIFYSESTYDTAHHTSTPADFRARPNP